MGVGVGVGDFREKVSLERYHYFLLSATWADIWMLLSVRPSVCPSVRPSVCPSVSNSMSRDNSNLAWRIFLIFVYSLWSDLIQPPFDFQIFRFCRCRVTGLEMLKIAQKFICPTITWVYSKWFSFAVHFSHFT